MKDVTAHLAEDTYRRLLAGTLPPDEARALSEHLAADCPTCEAFLAERAEVDPVDGHVDRALAAGAPGDAGNDLEFRRIERRLAAATPGSTRSARGSRGRLSGLAALAAAAVVVVGGVVAIEWADRSRVAPAWTGEKGLAAAAIPVRLRFLVVDPAGAIQKGVAGAAVAPDARLQFEVELGSAADVALVRVPERGAPDVFLRERLGAGRTAVSVDGRPAAYPLDGLGGPQRFVAIAAPGPLDDAGVLAAAARLSPPARPSADAAAQGVSIDVVDVVVRP